MQHYTYLSGLVCSDEMVEESTAMTKDRIAATVVKLCQEMLTTVI